MKAILNIKYVTVIETNHFYINIKIGRDNQWKSTPFKLFFFFLNKFSSIPTHNLETGNNILTTTKQKSITWIFFF